MPDDEETLAEFEAPESGEVVVTIDGMDHHYRLAEGEELSAVWRPNS